MATNQDPKCLYCAEGIPFSKLHPDCHEDQGTLIPCAVKCAEYEGKRLAYFVSQFETDEEGRYIPCIAVEGVKGYHRTNWRWRCEYKKAQELVVGMNERLGLNKQEALKIQASTM